MPITLQERNLTFTRDLRARSTCRDRLAKLETRAQASLKACVMLAVIISSLLIAMPAGDVA